MLGLQKNMHVYTLLRTLRSNLRSMAGSNSHGRFVLARNTTALFFVSTPSNCFNNSFLIRRVCSSSVSVLARHNESISSKKMIEGACSVASRKSWRISFSLPPNQQLMTSEAEVEKNVDCASPAIAFASIVFPAKTDVRTVRSTIPCICAWISVKVYFVCIVMRGKCADNSYVLCIYLFLEVQIPAHDSMDDVSHRRTVEIAEE